MTDVHFGELDSREYAHGGARPNRSSHRRAFSLLCVLGAMVVDSTAILSAGAVVSLISGDAFHTLLPASMISLPTYYMAGLCVGAFNLSILAAPWTSAQRAAGALFLLMPVVLLQATAANWNPLPLAICGELLVAALLSLMVCRFFVALACDQAKEALAPHVIVLTDRSRDLKHFQESITVVSTASLETPDASQPEFLERIAVVLTGADRIILSFASEGSLRKWVRVIRLSGFQGEIIDPSHLAPIGVGDWKGAATLIVARPPLMDWQDLAKRTLDVTLTVLALPMLIPLCTFIAVIVCLDSPGPPLFVQRRVGLHNKQYRCLKFRTMRTDRADPEGRISGSRDDPRVTNVGAFLRRTSLDELPQLINVLRGEMSLVGPRPHALGSTAGGRLFWENSPDYWLRHSVRPGMTGLAQVRGHRGATASKRELDLRLASDMEYIRSWSLFLDVLILLRTPIVMFHRNAF